MLVGILAGCRSAKPPQPQPRSITEATRSTAQAGKLMEARNWQSAATEWKKAVDEYFLVNDLTNAAVALHNLGQAERELTQYNEARKDLEQAAELNNRLRRKEEWFRNQIALLQLDSVSGHTNEPGARLQKLSAQLSEIRNASLSGTFLVEAGLFEQSQGQLSKAAETFQHAAREFEAVHDRFGTATVLANQAKLFEQQMNYPAAMDAWHAALAQFEALADPPGVTRSVQGLGRTLLLAKMDLANAEQYLRQAVRNFQSLHDEAGLIESLGLLKKCLTLQGKPEEPNG